MRFQLGKLVATPRALEAMKAASQDPVEFVSKHCTGNWGEVSREDAEANERAVDTEERILSVYRTCFGVQLYVITEADRSATTILLPEEY